MKNIIRRRIFTNRRLRFIIFTTILIYLITLSIPSVFKTQNDDPIRPRGVVVTLIRSTDKSILLAINMINSVVTFHSINDTYIYPFLIFHDENFTSTMREKLLSCIHKHNKHIRITFGLVHFRTDIQVDKGSRSNKPIDYRIMCRFWTYDVYYHPIFVQGRYDYLMRMDDDSYFSDGMSKDLFAYMENQKLDYIYRSTYWEPSPAMDPILKKHTNGAVTNVGCIYNNFFVMRIQWFYQSESVQKFLKELMADNLMLRQYTGDGCAHAAMLQVDKQVKVQHVTDIPYGHNHHISPAGQSGWGFHHTPNLHDDLELLCRELRILRDVRRRFIFICIISYIIIWFIIFRLWFSKSLSLPAISFNQLDHFLTSTLCGQLIRYPNLTLTSDELIQLNNDASTFLLFPNDCSFFKYKRNISTEESLYPLAFTILIHSNIDQFDFLLRTIYRSQNYYCIHVDLKAPLSLYQAIEARSKCVDNIYLPSIRLNVSWGQFSVLEAEHLCQKVLLNKSKQWKYYFNLANSDIPLKTNKELVQILKLYNEQNDITSLPYLSPRRQQKALINHTLPSSIRLPFYKGEFHVLLTRLAVEYIHQDSRVYDLYNLLNGTIVPDEHYYSMINRWKETPGYYPYDHDLSQITFMTRYKIWSDRPEGLLCHGGFIRGICVFNYQDLWHLATSPHLFANKIFFQRDRLVSYCMAQYLDVRDNMRQEQEQFSMISEEFYQQLENVKYGKEKSL